MSTKCHVNQHVIRANRKADAANPPQPVLTVKRVKRNVYRFEVEILGPSRVVYRPGKPLSCGAEVWVETDSPVRVDGRDLDEIEGRSRTIIAEAE